jgi:hypothetical protein
MFAVAQYSVESNLAMSLLTVVCCKLAVKATLILIEPMPATNLETRHYAKQLAVADQPLQLISDSEDETLQLTVSATAANAKYNTLAFHAVNFIVTDTVAELSRYGLRTVRSHLSSLSLRVANEEGGKGRMDCCRLAIKWDAVIGCCKLRQ